MSMRDAVLGTMGAAIAGAVIFVGGQLGITSGDVSVADVDGNVTISVSAPTGIDCPVLWTYLPEQDGIEVETGRPYVACDRNGYNLVVTIDAEGNQIYRLFRYVDPIGHVEDPTEMARIIAGGE